MRFWYLDLVARLLNPWYEGPLPSDMFVKQHPDYCLEQGQRCTQWFEGVCLRCGAPRKNNPIGDDPQCQLSPPFAPAPPYRHDDCVWLEWEGWRYAPKATKKDMARWSGEYDGRYRQPFRPEVFPRNVYAQGFREGQRHQRNRNVMRVAQRPAVPRPTIPGPAVPGSTVPRPTMPGPAVPGRTTTRGFKCGYGAKLLCYPVIGGGQFCECCGTTTCYAPKVV